MRPKPVALLGAATIALFAFSVGWWLIVYGQVVLNTGMEPAATVPCLFYTSDRCSLAMALCKDSHFLGIKRYFTEPIWLAGSLAILALAIGKRAERS